MGTSVITQATVSIVSCPQKASMQSKREANCCQSEMDLKKKSFDESEAERKPGQKGAELERETVCRGQWNFTLNGAERIN